MVLRAMIVLPQVSTTGAYAPSRQTVVGMPFDQPGLLRAHLPIQIVAAVHGSRFLVTS